MKKTIINSISFLEKSKHFVFLQNISRGVERESLRIDPSGKISQAIHPQTLGASLTHPFITTDFSEALMEFVTPVFNNPKDLIQFLNDLHVFTIQNIGDEMLWPLSMPYLEKNQSIPIAQFGPSNLGKFKELYRRGLHHRYGSSMQTIAGIHYNFSMPEEFWEPYRDFLNSPKSLMDFKSDRYLNLIRNVHKYGWLLLYLFGSSPSISPHFPNSPEKTSGMLSSPDNNLLYYPFATSLRMSHLGYHNKASNQLSICHRNLESYIEDILQAVQTKDFEFSKIGIFKDGQRIQISDNLLQIENEYYSSIRPKRKTLEEERTIVALKKRGIEYVELRNIDINPYSPVGIDESQIRFLDVFLTWCLFTHADTCNHETETHQKHNHQEVVLNGRNPDAQLLYNGKQISLQTYAHHIFEELLLFGNLFATATGENYIGDIQKYQEFITNPDNTLSARLLKETLRDGLHEIGVQKSLEYKKFFLEQKISKDRQILFERARIESINKKEEIESKESMLFEEYINQYLKQI